MGAFPPFSEGISQASQIPDLPRTPAPNGWGIVAPFIGHHLPLRAPKSASPGGDARKGEGGLSPCPSARCFGFCRHIGRGEGFLRAQRGRFLRVPVQSGSPWQRGQAACSPGERRPALPARCLPQPPAPPAGLPARAGAASLPQPFLAMTRARFVQRWSRAGGT